jgi:hypothetical protein
MVNNHLNANIYSYLETSGSQSCNLYLMDHLHWQNLLAIMPATATSVFTCLGHLGQYDNQGKYIKRDIAGVMVRDIALNIANVNSA